MIKACGCLWYVTGTPWNGLQHSKLSLWCCSPPRKQST